MRTRELNSFRYALVAAVAATSLVGQPSPSAAADTERQVSLRFEVMVGDRPFTCGTQYENVGTTRSTISATDFRMYVSSLRLVSADGREVPIALTQDSLWQYEDVALLDFEDGTRSCANGTPDLHTTVEGRVPDGRYVGVRFALGLPFEKNHREPTLQPSPLNLTKMFWNWNAGYKFVRIDLKTTGQPQGWEIHLGSTGCTPREGPTTVPMTCASPNQVAVDLPSFDIDRDVVRFDLAALLEKSNVDANQPETPTGCMSGPGDDDCVGLFAQFGLAFREAQAGEQHVFSVRRPAATAAGGPR